MKISHRLARIQPSATLAVESRAKELRAQGIDVLGFGAGEPDFDTPTHIKDAAKAALDRGATKYTPVGGTKALRDGVAAWLSRAHGLTFRADEVIVSCGAKHVLSNLFLTLLDEGDEVLIPAPYWVSYPDLVTLAGGQPVIVPTRSEDEFKVSIEALARAMTKKTRALVLCSPSNPTGLVYTQRDLDPIARLCVERNVLMISDDIYRSLVYGVEPGHVSRHSEEARRLTVFVDGVSKTYAMTGFRIGFCAGPKELIAAMETVQSQTTSNPNSIAQEAALAAITGPQDSVAQMREAFDARRRRMVELLRAMPGVRLIEPRGAFYAFPDVSAVSRSDVDLAKRLLDEQRIALVPGTPFGAPGHLRLSYATSMQNIEAGLARLREGLAAAAKTAAKGA